MFKLISSLNLDSLCCKNKTKNYSVNVFFFSSFFLRYKQKLFIDLIVLQNTTRVIFGLTRVQLITITHMCSVQITRNEHMLEENLSAYFPFTLSIEFQMHSALLFVYMSAGVRTTASTSFHLSQVICLKCWVLCSCLTSNFLAFSFCHEFSADYSY